jgi:hypothetical protein
MRDLVGAGLALFLSLLGLLFAAPQIQRNSRLLLDAPNAYQVQSFAQAANAYLSVPATFSAVLAATLSGNVQISATTLMAAGGLDPSFVDRNGYGQTHAVIVHRMSPTQLEALVMTCGGRAIADQSTRHLIELAGGPIKGGGVPAVGILSTNPNVAIGANGGLNVALTSFGGTACTPAPGHIGAALYLDGSQIIPPYLFTNPVPGAGTGPNTMNTTLFMGGNDVQNTHDVYSSTKLRWMSQSIQDALQGPDGMTVAKPTCPNGVPQIFTSPVAFSDNGIGLPMIGVQTYAVDNGSSWTAHLVVTTQNSSGTGTTQITPGAAYGQILALAKCT